MKIVLNLKPEDVEALEAISEKTGETMEAVAYRIGIRNLTETWLDAFRTQTRRAQATPQ